TSVFNAFPTRRSSDLYQYYLKPENDEKVTSIAENIVEVIEANGGHEPSDYLTAMSHLGYTIYLVDQLGDGETFGEPFRTYNLNRSEEHTSELQSRFDL